MGEVCGLDKGQVKKGFHEVEEGWCWFLGFKGMG